MIPVVTVIEFVVLVPVHPDGKLQIYSEAPVTAAIEKVSEVEGQTAVEPDIFPGAAGVPGLTVIANNFSFPVAQSFFAFTVIFPPVFPVFTVIEFVVLLPVHPEGNVQIYSVAPLTLAIE